MANHIQISNAWSLVPVFGNDREGKPKKQADTYTYIKVSIRYDLEHIKGLIEGKLAERSISFRRKDMQTLDTKTRYAFVGTWNQFCPAGVYEQCLEALPKHEEYMIKNQGKNKKWMGEEFPSFMVRRSNVRLPDLKVIEKEDADYINYFYHLRYCLVIEVADRDWDRFRRVVESFDAADGFKGIISNNCHMLELFHGNVTNAEKIRWCKKLKLHMNFNHNYSTFDLPGVSNLNWPSCVKMADKSKPPYKKTTLRKELLNMQRKDGKKVIQGVIPVLSGRSRGMITILFYNNDQNQSFVDVSLGENFPAFCYQYWRKVAKYSERCALELMNGFVEEEKLAALDSKWDADNYRVKTLKGAATSDFISEMSSLGMVDIPQELLAQMRNDKKGVKGKKFDNAAMERVAEAMRFNDGEGCDLTNVGSGATRFSNTDAQTTGAESNRSTTTKDVQRDLQQFRQDFNRLKLRLRELSPEDPLFLETFFSDDPLDDMSLTSAASTDLKKLLKLTKSSLLRLRSRIAKIEQGGPRLSGSAVSSPADGDAEMAQES